VTTSQQDVQRVGVQRPRILWTPDGITSTAAGTEVTDLAESAGLYLDPWQRLCLKYGLAERADGNYAASDVGVCVSRQNGKGSILEAVELGDLFLLDTEVCIHSAHLFETSKEAQVRLLNLIEGCPSLDRDFTRYKGKVWLSAGQEGIEVTRDGKKRRLKFKTRTKGGGRGLTGDRVIIDEAMYYFADQDAALRPTLSARPNPQMWLTGSAGNKESTMFGKMRNQALKGTAPRLFWAEWSINGCDEFCGEDCDEHDRPDAESSYAKANPGLGIRITTEHIEGERRMMDPDMFRIERLGQGDWPVEDDAWRMISEDAWWARSDSNAGPQAPFVFALDVTPDKSWACITVCGATGDGRIAIEITSQGTVVDHRQGTNWLVRRCVELWKRWKAPFVLDKGAQAGAFIDQLEAAGVKLIFPTIREYAQGCGMIHSAIVPRKGNTPNLVHCGQPSMTNAVAGADKRDLADLWAWDRRNASTDISPLVSATLAWWGYAKTTDKPKPRPKAAWG
jgi:hypothetical protein